MSIIIILSLTLAFQYRGWIGKYRVEGQAKQVYNDLMRARARALAVGKVHFINMPASSAKEYFVFEDVDDNGALNIGTDTAIINGALDYDLVEKNSVRQFMISSKGLITDGNELLGSEYEIRLNRDTELDPDYDCVVVSATRVNLGKYNGTLCEQK